MDDVEVGEEIFLSLPVEDVVGHVEGLLCV